MLNPLQKQKYDKRGLSKFGAAYQGMAPAAALVEQAHSQQVLTNSTGEVATASIAAQSIKDCAPLLEFDTSPRQATQVKLIDERENSEPGAHPRRDSHSPLRLQSHTSRHTPTHNSLEARTGLDLHGVNQSEREALKAAAEAANQQTAQRLTPKRALTDTNEAELQQHAMGQHLGG